MANVPIVSTIKEDGRVLFITVCMAFDYSDGFRGCNWHLFDEDGHVISYGYSRGWDQQGAGSAIYAMRYARRAARRYLKRQAKKRRFGMR